MSQVRMKSFIAANASAPPGHVVEIEEPGSGRRIVLTATYSWDTRQVCVYFEAVDSSGRPAYEDWLQKRLDPRDLGSVEDYILAPQRRNHLPFCSSVAARIGSEAANALILAKALSSLERQNAAPGLASAESAVRAAMADNSRLLRIRRERAGFILGAYLEGNG